MIDHVCVCVCVQECEEDPCCEYRTCKLKSGAQCAYGECCSNCQVNTASLVTHTHTHCACVLGSVTVCLCVQFLPGATVCRASTDECDLPEFCNGSSSLCQSDVFIQVRSAAFT